MKLFCNTSWFNYNNLPREYLYVLKCENLLVLSRTAFSIPFSDSSGSSPPPLAVNALSAAIILSGSFVRVTGPKPGQWQKIHRSITIFMFSKNKEFTFCLVNHAKPCQTSLSVNFNKSNGRKTTSTRYFYWMHAQLAARERKTQLVGLITPNLDHWMDSRHILAVDQMCLS